jgi:hypothetical protein
VSAFGCPICGRIHEGPCDPKRLKAIDAANRRAMNREDEELPSHRDREPSYSRRLSDGFEMLSEDYED